MDESSEVFANVVTEVVVLMLRVGVALGFILGILDSLG